MPRNRPILWALAASLAVAGLSFLLEPFALLPDPWAWSVWGDELLRFDLDTTSGPSWKPLPVFVVAVLSVGGDAAPVLWDLVARILRRPLQKTLDASLQGGLEHLKRRAEQRA